MTEFSAAACQTTLFEALLVARKANGGKKAILRDPDGTELTYDKLIVSSLVLGRKLADQTPSRDPIGVLLPNVAGLVVTLFGLNAFGLAVSMLNYTAGYRNLASAIKTGCIRQIITSHRFIDKGNLHELVEQLKQVVTTAGPCVEFVYLEDVRASINWRDKLRGVLSAWRPHAAHQRYKTKPNETAVLLFTSGTEGVPKGVSLSNANVVSNARQIFAHGTGFLLTSDRVINPLPMFHSFGLTAGTLMPILNGMAVTLYPSPLHYREIPKLIRDERATILFATDTFLAGYAKAAKPGDLDTIRYIVAGAERVKDASRALWNGTKAEILEGYGATECSPVIAVNLPNANRHGSVGRLLPGIEAKLTPVEGIAEGGRLMVRGPNVMAGYMLAELPGVLVPSQDGWHDTGDIVTIDDGFVTIRGRAKRFAKLGGEMVSLAAVESLAAGLWPDANHVVVALPDPKKGEQLVLVTDKPDAEKAPLAEYARKQGFPELWVPRAILVVPMIPMLGSGKTDLPATQEMVRQTRPML
jgi:acyl-[acyl-carrier-protein]-phospholipid O-acyltransferase / long-chain-fatty-acid--[acyl-carrier-protein] ligase